MPGRVLVLMDAGGELGSFVDTLRRAAGAESQVEPVYSAELLMVALSSGLAWDLVLLDCELGDGRSSGWDLLPTLRQRAPDLPVVALAARGSVEAAKRAVAAGASDFLVRSGHLEERLATLLDKVRPYLSLVKRHRKLEEHHRLLLEEAARRYHIVGHSPAMLAVLDLVERVAAVPRPVLVRGERGTGKELVARAIHQASERPGPFVAVNCAAFSEALLESELFGHERGAFTGAERKVLGKFELAGEGTLFLDEIGNMPLSFQQKILRVVEYGTLRRVGGAQEIKVQARIVAATNADLERAMDQGRFQKDLYDRLAFAEIVVPPLRERPVDVAPLARHFLAAFALEVPGVQAHELEPAALEALERQPFPGNVRELKTMVERAAYRTGEPAIRLADLGLQPVVAAPCADLTGSFAQAVEALKRRLVIEALDAEAGNQAAAARRLELSYDQYRYYLRRYGRVASRT